MQSQTRTVVVLGTGGTIAGTAARPDDNVGYRAAQLGVAELFAALRGALPDGVALESEQVAQLNSKDMTHAVWAALAARVAAHVARLEVAGVVAHARAPTRWRRRRTSCSACWRRPSPSG